MKWNIGMIVLMVVETLLVTAFIVAYRTSADPYVSIGGSFMIFNILIGLFLLINSIYCWYYLGLGRFKRGGD
ncbi:MAG: hypothetical protein QXS54_12795 [Candidatus Methanomethylicaceae archaeon]